MIGVIADDLSGAAEIGAVAWDHGLSARLMGADQKAPVADVLCVNTDSRSLTVEGARQRVARAVDFLSRCGVDWTYKKVDSVLRGHVVEEVRCLQEKLGLRHALIVPANPSKGRCIQDGQYTVDGVPLHETGFARDPEYPRTTSDVAALLGAVGEVCVASCESTERTNRAGMVVGEAASPEDVQCWANRRCEFGLVGGGAEFFEALIRRETGMRSATRTETGWERQTGAELFVCGSISQSTLHFIEEQTRAGVRVLEVPDNRPGGAADPMAARLPEVTSVLASGHRLILTTPRQQLTDRDRALDAARLLVDVAREVLRNVMVPHIYVEGGATATLLLEAMQWRDPLIEGQLAPGVVVLRVASGPDQFVIVKPGSYPWPAALRCPLPKGECHAH